MSGERINITLSDGSIVKVKEIMDYSTGHDYYTVEGIDVSFDTIEEVINHLNSEK